MLGEVRGMGCGSLAPLPAPAFWICGKPGQGACRLCTHLFPDHLVCPPTGQSLICPSGQVVLAKLLCVDHH